MALIATLAMFACLLIIGAPGAQTFELDTGPQLELVDVHLDTDARAVLAVFDSAATLAAGEVLKSYCIESAIAVEIPTVARDTAEHARYESGRRSGVARPCADDLERFDFMRLHGTTPHPLRC